MTALERSTRLESLRCNLMLNELVCCCCGRKLKTNFHESVDLNYSLYLMDSGSCTSISVTVEALLKLFGFFVYVTDQAPKVCKYCFESISLLPHFQNRSTNFIKKAHQIQKPKVFETICYNCFKLLGDSRHQLYFGRKIYERKREEYVLAAFLRELCNKCNVKILPPDLEVASLCSTCHYQLTDLRNFKKKTLEFQEAVKMYRDGNRDHRALPTLRPSYTAATTGWSVPGKLTFASLEQRSNERISHIPPGVQQAASFCSLPPRPSGLRQRPPLYWTDKELDVLLDVMSRHYRVGVKVVWADVFQELMAKGYHPSHLRKFQTRWYGLKSQASAFRNSAPKSPGVDWILKMMQGDKTCPSNTENRQPSSTSEENTISTMQPMESDQPRWLAGETVSTNESNEDNITGVVPAELCSAEVGAFKETQNKNENENICEQNAPLKFKEEEKKTMEQINEAATPIEENTHYITGRDAAVEEDRRTEATEVSTTTQDLVTPNVAMQKIEEMTIEEQIRYHKDMLAKLGSTVEHNKDQLDAFQKDVEGYSVEDIEDIFQIKITDYRFNKCLIQPTETIEIKEDEEEVIIID